MGPSSRSLLAACFLLMVCGVAMSQTELVGPLTREDILTKLPEWKPYIQAYSPDLETVRLLQNVHEEATIEIFLGTWCPDCRQHVSAYLKLMDMVRNPLIKTTFTGIPRKREMREEYTAGRNIERVPTFIVHFRGREIGRLIETPKVSVEADLWAILAPELSGR
jgi:thiol-disulfide isomerase/thioredoxin